MTSDPKNNSSVDDDDFENQDESVLVVFHATSNEHGFARPARPVEECHKTFRRAIRTIPKARTKAARNASLIAEIRKVTCDELTIHSADGDYKESRYTGSGWDTSADNDGIAVKVTDSGPEPRWFAVWTNG